MKQVLSVCPYCGCGCGIYLQIEGEQVTGAMPSFKHPVAQGRLCIRGWHAHELVTTPKRLTTPMLRKNGKLEPATWEEALKAAAGLSGLKEGPGSVGVLGSSRFGNEDNFVLMRLARAVLGTNNVDCSSRLARNPAMLGAPGFMKDSIPALGECEAVVVCGSDVSEQLPKAATEMLLAAWRGVPLIAISPRADLVSKCADHALRARPDTEALVVDGLVHLLVSDSGGDQAAPSEIAEAVAEATPEAVEQTAGVPPATLRAAAAELAGGKRVAVLYGTGVTQSVTAEHTVAALSRLAAVIGGVDARAEFLSPDCNFHGACDVGIHPQSLSGYQPVAEADGRAKFERAWSATLPAEPGLDASAMLGRVKGMLVMGDDPIANLVSSHAAGRALEGLDLLVVIDMFMTETAARAHVVLPSASFAEADATFTNAERRVQRLRAAIAPVGESRPAWQIICDLAKAMGSPFDYASPSAIMDEIVALTPLYAGCSYAALDQGWGWQWPLPTAPPAPAARPLPEIAAVDAEHPLLLAIDGTLYPWESDVRPLAAPTLEREHNIHARDYREGFVEMNSADASGLQLRSGQVVEVVSRHGSTRLQAVVSGDVPPGTVLVPYQSREKVLALFGDADAVNGRLPAPCPVAIRRT